MSVCHHIFISGHVKHYKVLCRKFIGLDNCWRKSSWTEFQAQCLRLQDQVQCVSRKISGNLADLFWSFCTASYTEDQLMWKWANADGRVWHDSSQFDMNREQGIGFLGRGQRAPSPPARGSGERCKLPIFWICAFWDLDMTIGRRRVWRWYTLGVIYTLRTKSAWLVLSWLWRC